ncbi:MAG: hypothetical protein II670_10860 [Alphaproteobacteria bacterium]|nr:hypothetical protein [Alphaproteobacteria bacterium]
MVYFAFSTLTLLGVWIFLSWKDEILNLDEKYTDTRPSYNRSHMFPIEKDDQEEAKPKNKEKQKIKIT